MIEGILGEGMQTYISPYFHCKSLSMCIFTGHKRTMSSLQYHQGDPPFFSPEASSYFTDLSTFGVELGGGREVGD